MKHVIQMFIEAGRIGAALSEAARWGEIELVRELLHQTAVDTRNENGGTALMNAASAGEIQILRLLLERGANVNAIHEKEGYTPLMWCLAALHPEHVYLSIVEILLNSGADVNVRGRDGRTALDLAKPRGSDRLVQLLESARAASES